MDQRVSFLTLAVREVATSKAFYCDGLGWEPSMYVEGEVLMIKVGAHVVLSLWDRDAMAAEVGRLVEGDGVPPVALAHNVPTREEVDEIIGLARRLGAEPIIEPQERVWGGYTGYLADPDGYRWEIAWNPGEIGQEVLP